MLHFVIGAAFAACGLAATITTTVRPVVIWHGLGDGYPSSGLLQFENEIQKLHPGIFTHMIQLGEDAKTDERATFVSLSNFFRPPVHIPFSTVVSTTRLPSSPHNSRIYLSSVTGSMALDSLKVACFSVHTWSATTIRPCTTLLLLAPRTWAYPTYRSAVPSIFSVR